MEVVDVLAGVALVCCLLVLAIVARRSLLRRTGATLDLCLRYPGTTATGWALGVAKLGDDRLLWYRVFSFAPRPKVSIARGGFEIRERRRPAHAESLSLMAGRGRGRGGDPGSPGRAGAGRAGAARSAGLAGVRAARRDPARCGLTGSYQFGSASCARAVSVLP